MTLEDLGMWGDIIRMVWYLSGIIFVVYFNKKTESKFRVSDIICVVFGPICWTTVLLMYLYRKILGRTIASYDCPSGYLTIEIMFMLSGILWLILLIWFGW